MKQEKVVNSQGAASRARVDCLLCSQSGFIDKPISSQTTGARACVREERSAIRCREAYFRAWRIAKFGGDFDPIRVAVDEAVAAFSYAKGEAGRKKDRDIWLKIANRVGFENFLDALDQKKSEMRELEAQGKRLLTPAASFQKLLNRRFPTEGGAR